MSTCTHRYVWTLHIAKEDVQSPVLSISRNRWSEKLVNIAVQEEEPKIAKKNKKKSGRSRFIAILASVCVMYQKAAVH